MVPRASIDKASWDAFVYRHNMGWFWHTSHWLDYSLAYTPGAYDKSFAALGEGGAIIAIVPLVDSDEGLVMGGQITPAPIFEEQAFDIELASKVHTYAEKKLDGRRPMPIQLRPGQKPQGPPPPSLRVHTGSTHVVDLRAEEVALWRNIRRSYKSLIRRAEEKYTLGVYTKREAVEAARALHLKAAGRQTRPDETWHLMADWAAGGLAVVALASGADGPQAFAYVIRYKKWAYYASGASLVPNVSHALQWHIIRALRFDGETHLYEVGYDADRLRSKSVSGEGIASRGEGIAHFKAGFGSFEVPVIVVSAA